MYDKIAFFIVVKYTYIKFTILIIFILTIQWHLSNLTMLCNHHHYVSPELSLHLKQNLYPLHKNFPFFPLFGLGNFYFFVSMNFP